MQGYIDQVNGTGQDNKEYCKLTILENNQHSTTECNHVGYTNESRYGGFKYCPYCGKEIRVQELEK